MKSPVDIRESSNVPTCRVKPHTQRLPVALLRSVIRGYQIVLSPMIGPRCRYQPTCSAYAIEAIEAHGPARGLWLALKRFLRCHPWGGHGWDPVPPVASSAGGRGDDPAHKEDIR